jgi:hypothetical protein
MSLNTSEFKQELKAVYTDTLTTTGSSDAALDAFLDAFTVKLEAYIKTAQVVYTNGLTAGPYLVTGTFNGKVE